MQLSALSNDGQKRAASGYCSLSTADNNNEKNNLILWTENVSLERLAINYYFKLLLSTVFRIHPSIDGISPCWTMITRIIITAAFIVHRPPV
mgnify:FL=1